MLAAMMIRRALSTSMTARSYTSVVNTASRGIGLEFVTQLLHREGATVFAVCRSPDVPDALSKLTSEYGEERLKVITGVDLEDPKSIEHGCQVIAEQCSEGVDLLINCAGILGDHSVEMR